MTIKKYYKNKNYNFIIDKFFTHLILFNFK